MMNTNYEGQSINTLEFAAGKRYFQTRGLEEGGDSGDSRDPWAACPMWRWHWWSGREMGQITS